MTLQKVKHLYLDEKGRLLADIEGWESAVDRTPLRQRAVAVVCLDESGKIPSDQSPPAPKIGSPLPEPGPDWEGLTVIHREGGKTEVMMCVQNSAEDYEWIEIGEST